MITDIQLGLMIVALAPLALVTGGFLYGTVLKAISRVKDTDE